MVRDHQIGIVSPHDFVVEQGEPISSAEVLADPRFTFYCFDPGNKAALFVEGRDPAATDRAPFYYQGQIDQAEGLVSMPLDEFHRVAKQIPPPPAHLIFVHSVGRCGSTLMSKVLQAVPGVHSLSEPDDLTQLVLLRTTREASEEWVRAALASSIRWRCKVRTGVPARFVAIKPRSEVMVLGDLLGELYPEARHFFLYRNAVAWMRTIYRTFRGERDLYDNDLNRQMEEGWARMLPLVRDLRVPEAPMNPIQIRILGWSTCMEGYLRLCSGDLALCAARFEDLTADPVGILRQFFRFCEIEDVDWSAVDEVLSRDSLAGTIYDREERAKQTRELTDALVQDIYDVLASRPLLGSPDLVLPKTLRLEEPPLSGLMR